MAIDATVSGSSSNSYVTLSEANSYFASHPFSSVWLAFTDTQKENLLVRSAVLIDSLKFFGVKSVSTQKRQWPRFVSFALSNEIPERVKFAQMEQAIQESVKISSSVKPDEISSGVESFKLGNYSESYSSSSVSVASSPLGQLCSSARSFLRGLYCVSSRMTNHERRNDYREHGYSINSGFEPE